MDKYSMNCDCAITLDDYALSGKYEENVINWTAIGKSLVSTMLKEKLKPILDKSFLTYKGDGNILDYCLPGEKLGLKIYVMDGQPSYSNNLSSVTVGVYYDIYDLESGVRKSSNSESIEVNVNRIGYDFTYNISGFIYYFEKEDTLILKYLSNRKSNLLGFIAIDNTVNDKRQIVMETFYQFHDSYMKMYYTDDASQCSTRFERYNVVMDGKIYMNNIPVVQNGYIVDMLERIKFIWCNEFNTDKLYYEESTGGKICTEGVYYEQIYGPFWVKVE